MINFNSILLDLPLEEGTTRHTCPKCSGYNTLCVTTEGNTIKWLCHRASCGFRGAKGGLLRYKKRTKTQFSDEFIPEKTTKHGYTTNPIYDAKGEVRGWEHRKNHKQVLGPKSLLDIQKAWCGMHFPTPPDEEYILLVEDRKSAEVMDQYFPTAALMGTNLNIDKIDYLKQAGVKRVIIALDNDATVKAIDMKKKWSMIDNVYPLTKDVKDMKAHELLDMVAILEEIYIVDND